MKYPASMCLALFICLTSISCNKSDDNNNNQQTIYTKNGLTLSGDQEVPAKTTGATGTMNVSYDKNTKMLAISASWQNLSGDPAAAHIHGPAAKGKNAGVVVDFHDNVTSATGNFSRSVSVDGISIKEDSLLAGYYYFNIHTAQNPAGEIRGQIEF